MKRDEDFIFSVSDEGKCPSTRGRGRSPMSNTSGVVHSKHCLKNIFESMLGCGDKSKKEKGWSHIRCTRNIDQEIFAALDPALMRY